MMRVPYTNTSDAIQHVGDVMVIPNTTRMVDPRCLPGAGAAPAQPEEAPADADPLAELLAMSVKDIITQLPALTEEEIGDLETLESAGDKPRKSLLEAFAAERLKRAMPSDDAEGLGTVDGVTGDA